VQIAEKAENPGKRNSLGGPSRHCGGKQKKKYLRTKPEGLGGERARTKKSIKKAKYTREKPRPIRPRERAIALLVGLKKQKTDAAVKKWPGRCRENNLISG